MKNVLLICYFFPPLNNIAARRYGQMVEFMEDMGWRVWVITTESEGSLPVAIPSSQIIRVSKNLQTKQHNKKNVSKAVVLTNKIKSLVIKTGFKPMTIDRTSFSWAKDVKNNKDKIVASLPKIDVVVSTFGPAAAFKLGIFFKKIYNVPAVLDFRDMAAFIDRDKNWFVKKLDRLLEKKYVSEYDRLITISPTLRDILTRNYSKTVDVIYNGWYVEDGYSAPEHEISKKKYIYYAGRIYKHRIPAMLMVLESIRNYDDIYMKIRSVSLKEVDEIFTNMVEKAGLKSKVEMLPQCDAMTSLKESAAAFINFVPEDLDPQNYWSKGTMTGKFMQLIPLDPPVLSVAMKENDMGRVLNETKRGRLCSTQDEVSEFIKDVVCNSGKYKLDNNLIAKYSKREQTKLLCSIFREITG